MLHILPHFRRLHGDLRLMICYYPKIYEILCLRNKYGMAFISKTNFSESSEHFCFPLQDSGLTNGLRNNIYPEESVLVWVEINFHVIYLLLTTLKLLEGRCLFSHWFIRRNYRVRRGLFLLFPFLSSQLDIEPAHLNSFNSRICKLQDPYL